MNKIPTLFKRDPENMSRVLDEVNPEAAWVFDGEAVATRKYDGTCVMLDDTGKWWARREVKPSKTPPPNYRPVTTDENTGKTMGWEPVEQSSFAKAFTSARWEPDAEGRARAGTYELCGPKVNGNPERYDEHVLIRHAEAETLESLDGREPGDLSPVGVRELVLWLNAEHGWEGIVWHHPDGRMAKIKARDYA